MGGGGESGRKGRRCTQRPARRPAFPQADARTSPPLFPSPRQRGAVGACGHRQADARPPPPPPPPPPPLPSPSRLRPHPSIPHGFSAYKPHGVGRIAHPHLVRSPRQLQYPWPSAPSGRCRAPARAPLPAPARRGRPDARGGGRIGEAATAMGGRKPAPVRNRYQRSGGSAAHGIAAQGGAALSQRPL